MEPRAILLLNALILVMLCVVMPLVTATVGGWRALSGRYRVSRSAPPGASWFISARFGPTPYLASLAIAPLEEGLYLARLPIYRLLHPPLLIPWSELRGMEAPSGRGRTTLLRVESPRVSLVIPARFVEVFEDGRVAPRGRPAQVGLGAMMGWAGSGLVLGLVLAVQVVLGVLPPRDPVVTWVESSGGTPFVLSWSSSREDDYSLWMDFTLTYQGPAWTIGGIVYPMVNGTGARGTRLTLNRNLKFTDDERRGGAFIEEVAGTGGEPSTARGRVRLTRLSSEGVADELNLSGTISGDYNVSLDYLRFEVVDD